MRLSLVHSLKATFKYADLISPFRIANQKRNLWLWFYNLFNKVDNERLEKVGPDRNCAEWILKNGGSVRFKIQNELINDYNDLAPDTSDLVRDHLVEIYADGATMNDYGFFHFKDCNHINKITFISCKLVGDKGLERLQLFLQDRLKYLELRSCYGITEIGILSLTEMRGLETLILYDLRGISDKTKCEELVRHTMRNTNCKINL